MKIHIGTSGWHYKHWLDDVFYPAGTKPAEMFDFYSQYFDTVEINNSFYHLPSATTFDNWRDSSPRGFLFAVKASRFITHMKKLKDPKPSSEKFFHVATMATLYLQGRMNIRQFAFNTPDLLWGVLFVIAGVISFISPENTFAAIADILGFLFLIVAAGWIIGGVKVFSIAVVLMPCPPNPLARWSGPSHSTRTLAGIGSCTCARSCAWYASSSAAGSAVVLIRRTLLEEKRH